MTPEVARNAILALKEDVAVISGYEMETVSFACGFASALNLSFLHPEYARAILVAAESHLGLSADPEWYDDIIAAYPADMLQEAAR